MKKYGDMTDADLDTWQMLPGVAPILISRQMGAWLKRRDERRDEQERKTGQWRYMGGMLFNCSECRHTIDRYNMYESRFCPWCGAKMTRGEQT